MTNKNNGGNVNPGETSFRSFFIFFSLSQPFILMEKKIVPTKYK